MEASGVPGISGTCSFPCNGYVKWWAVAECASQNPESWSEQSLA